MSGIDARVTQLVVEGDGGASPNRSACESLRSRRAQVRNGGVQLVSNLREGAAWKMGGTSRKVVERLPGKGNSNAHGAKHLPLPWPAPLVRENWPNRCCVDQRATRGARRGPRADRTRSLSDQVLIHTGKLLIQEDADIFRLLAEWKVCTAHSSELHPPVLLEGSMSTPASEGGERPGIRRGRRHRLPRTPQRPVSGEKQSCRP